MWMEELPNGKFTYRERYKDPYTEKYKKVSVTLNSKSNQAKNKAQRMLNEKIENKLNAKNHNKITFEKLTDEFWQYYPKTVKHRTAKRAYNNQKILNKKIGPEYIIGNIDKSFIQKTLDELYYQENYSLSTTKQVKSLISQIFLFGAKREYINYNPASNIIIKRKSDNSDNATPKFLETEEIRNLLNCIKNKRYRDMAEFMILTGLRYGELSGLTYDNNFDDYFVIDGTFDYTQPIAKKVKTSPKTNKSNRKIYHTARTKEIIKEVNEENKFLWLKDSVVKTDYIFCGIHGNPIGIYNFNRALQIAGRKAEIDKYISSHILRHTHISILSELGVELKTIMDRVGHTKPDVTLSIYTHVTKNMQQSMIDKLNNFKI